MVEMTISQPDWLTDTDRAPCLGQGGMTHEYVTLDCQG